MTIEVRQLVVRAVVTREAAAPAPERVLVPPSTGTHRRSPPSGPGAAPDTDAIVAACVREVLRKLDRARER